MKSLNEHSDEALCALSAQGNREAMECLVSRYNRLVRACARPYFLAGGDGEDLIQEGMIGLLSAVRGYSLGRGSAFRTYAQVCIQNRIRSAVRSSVRDKHLPLNQSVSLEQEGEWFRVDQEEYDDPEKTLIQREEQNTRLKRLREVLSPLEKAVLDLFLEGLSYQEISTQLHKPVKAIDNAVQRVRRKAAPILTNGESSES